MTTDLDVATAAVHVYRLLSGVDPSAPEVHGLLYYAQGMSLATRNVPLFEASFVATPSGVLSNRLRMEVMDDPSGWCRSLGSRRMPDDDALRESLRDVHEAFARLGPHGLTAAMRNERPWVRAREGIRWDDEAMPDVSITHLHDHFSQYVEDGEDAMEALSIPKDPDGPAWLRPYMVRVNLGYSSGHPLFDQPEAVRLRTALGYDAVPSVSSVAFSRLAPPKPGMA